MGVSQSGVLQGSATMRADVASPRCIGLLGLAGQQDAELIGLATSELPRASGCDLADMASHGAHAGGGHIDAPQALAFLPLLEIVHWRMGEHGAECIGDRGSVGLPNMAEAARFVPGSIRHLEFPFFRGS